VYGGFFDLNGNGEMTGQSYLHDFGVIQGPIGITNTNAIGQVYAGIQSWTQQRFGEAADPVVAETWDGELNDIRGFHVRPETAIAAIEAAKSGAIAEGSVGGGTGMECFGFKGGIGTASRKNRARCSRVYGRGARSVQHGRSQGAAHRRRPGWTSAVGTLAAVLRLPPLAPGEAAEMCRQRERRDTPTGCGLDHHRGRHQRAVDSDPA